MQTRVIPAEMVFFEITFSAAAKVSVLT